MNKIKCDRGNFGFILFCFYVYNRLHVLHGQISPKCSFVTEWNFFLILNFLWKMV